MRCILATTPLDLVDLLFDLEGLEIVELGFVRLELGVELVLTSLLLEGRLGVKSGKLVVAKTYSLVSLEQNHTTALVTCRQVVTRLVELDGGDDVRWKVTLAIALSERCAGVFCREQWGAGDVPSVMSSTSPLSPKHLAGSVPS